MMSAPSVVRRLSVSGPTGSGKSTFASFIGTREGVSLLPEPQPEELLRLFDQDPRKYCFDLQLKIITSRLATVDDRSVHTIVLDRSATEDFEIFAGMYQAAGFLSDEQYQVLCRAAAKVTATVGAPDAYVLLS